MTTALDRNSFLELTLTKMKHNIDQLKEVMISNDDCTKEVAELKQTVEALERSKTRLDKIVAGACANLKVILVRSMIAVQRGM